MRLRLVHGPCSPHVCPTLYVDEDDPTSVIVQADVVDAEGSGAALSPGEGLLRVPLSLLREGMPKVEAELRP
jgi:hypothetical protein